MNNQRCIMIPVTQYNHMVQSYEKALAELEELRTMIKNMTKGVTENE